MIEYMSSLLHIYGIHCVRYLQHVFKDYSDWMICITRLGDPRYALLIYFPIAYCVRPSTGIRVLCVACFSEWLNAICKWILHGDRPYWYVEDLQNSTSSRLKQFYLTCEIGPGSPSGHAMVTGAVLFVIVKDCIRHYIGEKRKLAKWCLWILLGVFLVAVNLSRLFIAAHFPHQVIMGSFIGVLIGEYVEHEHVTGLKLPQYLTFGAVLVVIGAVTFCTLLYLDIDPMWSINLAKMFCENPEWLHLDTSLFYSLIRDIACIIGFGFGIRLLDKLDVNLLTLHSKKSAVILQICFSLLAAFATEIVPKPNDNEFLLYISGSIRYICLMIVIAAVIPYLLLKICFKNINIKER